MLKVQTAERTETPLEAVQTSIDGLIGDFSLLEERLKTELRRVGAARR